MEKFIDETIMTFEEVASKYDRLLHKEANRYASKNPSSDVEDLYEEALIALYNAYNKYDAGNGSKFITYATRVIENRLTNFVRIDRNIVLPKDVYFNKEFDRSTIPSCSKALDVKIDDEHSVSDFIPCENENNNPEISYMMSNVRKSVYELDGLEREVIILKFGLKDNTTYKNTEIANILNISVNEVNKLYKSATSKLQDKLSDYKYN